MPLLTDLDVANAACLRIGVGALGEEGLEADDDRSRAIASAYDDTVLFNLGVYLFSWSKTIVQLSLDDLATPLSGYTKAFDLPPQRIGEPIYITDDVTDPKRRFSAFAPIGEKIESDATALWAQIRYRPAPNRWNPMFRSATITAVAAKLALTVREDKQLAKDLERLAYGAPEDLYRGGQFGAAIRADAFSTPPRKPNWADNPFERAWRADDTGSEDDC